MRLPTSATTLKWLQMISVRNCGKVIKGEVCPCADSLRKKTLKIPISVYDEEVTEREILEQRIKYIKCFDEKTYKE